MSEHLSLALPDLCPSPVHKDAMTFTAAASLPEDSSQQTRNSNGESRSSMLTGVAAGTLAATATAIATTPTAPLLVPVSLPALPGGVTQTRPADTGLERKHNSTANHSVPPPLDSSLPILDQDRTVGSIANMDTVKEGIITVMGKETINKANFDNDGTPINWTEIEIDPSAALLPQPELFNGWSTKTGYVYDVRMKHHNNVHGDDDHPEDPRRIWRIYDAIRNAKCTDRMIKITSREATVDELGLVHTDHHIENITKTSAMSKDDLLEMANSYNSIYLNNLSAFCARLSCGSLIELCKAVASGQVLNGVAIIRPPGHHAEPHEAGGFCLYNNVAIAARYLQQNHGLKKIFILDWDVHHGNGTQTAFIDDPDVVYCSIHRFDHGVFYPGDPVAAAHTTVGEGLGRGRTINIPWNSSGMGDSEYLYAFSKVIMPILYEFAPDFILVSAGFDAAKGDHIGQMLVTPAAYGHMTHMLKSLAGGKIILALEGGYNLDSIAVSGLACVKALLNDPTEALDPIQPNALCVQTIHDVIKVQSRYWQSLPPTYANAEDDMPAEMPAIGMDKVLAAYQEIQLRETYSMIKMPRLDGKDRSEFLDHVHCTQQLYNNNKPLYIFIHDLGELCARTVGTTNAIRPQKSVLIDAMTQYIDHIISTGNELIDVVVPYLPTTEEEKVMLKDQQSNVLADLWSTLLATSAMEGRRIVVLATGFGCHGLVAFLNEKQKEVPRYLSSVTLVLGDDTMPMVTKKLSPWYIENSFVMASDDHPVWERTSQKMNSRTGNLLRTERPSERLSETLLFLRKRIFGDIDSKLESLPAFPTSDSGSVVKAEDAAGTMELEFPPMQTRSGRLSMQMDRLSKSEASTPERQRQAASPQMQSVSSNLLPSVRNGTRRGQQSNSRPGSPLLNGSIPGPVQALVERPTVMGPQRSQPYPQGNNRDSGPSSVNSSPRVSAAMPLRNTGPQNRIVDPNFEVLETKMRPISMQQQQQQQQQQQKMQQQLQQQRVQDMYMHEPHRRQPPHPQQAQQSGPQQQQQQGRHEMGPYGSYPSGPPGDGRQNRMGSGPGEYYPPHSGSNGSSGSPSTMTPPHQHPVNGSPRSSIHAGMKPGIPPMTQQQQQQQQLQKQQHLQLQLEQHHRQQLQLEQQEQHQSQFQQHGHHHPQHQQQQQQQQFGYPPSTQGNGSSRQGPTSGGPPGGPPMDSIHPSHRRTYSTQEPPPPQQQGPPGHGPGQGQGRELQPHGQPTHPNGRALQQQQQQQHQQAQHHAQHQQQQHHAQGQGQGQAPSGRMKRSEPDVDPFGNGQYVAAQSRQQQEAERRQDAERRQVWMERRGREMEQAKQMEHASHLEHVKQVEHAKQMHHRQQQQHHQQQQQHQHQQQQHHPQHHQQQHSHSHQQQKHSFHQQQQHHQQQQQHAQHLAQQQQQQHQQHQHQQHMMRIDPRAAMEMHPSSAGRK